MPVETTRSRNTSQRAQQLLERRERMHAVAEAARPPEPINVAFHKPERKNRLAYGVGIGAAGMIVTSITTGLIILEKTGVLGEAGDIIREEPLIVGAAAAGVLALDLMTKGKFSLAKKAGNGMKNALNSKAGRIAIAAGCFAFAIRGCLPTNHDSNSSSQGSTPISVDGSTGGTAAAAVTPSEDRCNDLEIKLQEESSLDGSTVVLKGEKGAHFGRAKELKLGDAACFYDYTSTAQINSGAANRITLLSLSATQTPSANTPATCADPVAVPKGVEGISFGVVPDVTNTAKLPTLEVNFVNGKAQVCAATPGVGQVYSDVAYGWSAQIVALSQSQKTP